jgi:hypothetical protein
MLIVFVKSQGSLFASVVHVPASQRADGTTVAPYTRVQKVRRPAAPKAKVEAPPELFAPEDMPDHAERKEFADRVAALNDRVQRFASGMSRVRDFSAAVHAGHGVGVEVNQLSDNAMRELAQQVVNNNAEVFIDSGAFGLFKRGMKLADDAPAEQMNFDDVLARYDRFMEYVGDANVVEEHVVPPLVVMPDVVGDQTASLNLIAQHAGWIRLEAQFNLCRPIIPLQRGTLSIGEAYDHVVAMLGTDNFVCGIPSNAAAVSGEEFTDFLRSRQPKAVHILGALHDKRLTPRLEQIVDAGVDRQIMVSADANVLRSQIIEQGVSGDARAARIVDRLGVRARAHELANVIESYGGADGIRSVIAGESPDRQERLIGLVSDLSGRSIDDVRREYLG